MKPQITRLRVEQIRRFRSPLELGGFEPGLNIVAAPNEAGKSTLVRAIRAAFFHGRGRPAALGRGQWRCAARRTRLSDRRPEPSACEELSRQEALHPGCRHAFLRRLSQARDHLHDALRDPVGIQLPR